VVEGADAPTAGARTRANVTNVVQIFHDAVTTSYTKQAATGQYATPGSAPFFGPTGSENPVNNEHAWQVQQALKEMALDVNYTFWHGALQQPTTIASARKTAGLLSVATSNVVSVNALTAGASAATDTITVTHDLVANDKVVFTDVGVATTIVKNRAYYVVSPTSTTAFKVAATQGGTAITIGTATVSFYGAKAAETISLDNINTLLQSVYDNGGISQQETATLFVSSSQKRRLSAAYAAAYGQADPMNMTRSVAGVNVNTIVTDFGTLNVVIDRHMPQDAVAVVSLEQVAPVFLNIPGKGVLFEEELAKTGASEKSQIYGEIGLQYGNELAHGVLRGAFP
jgi:hypothetical protein